MIRWLLAPWWWMQRRTDLKVLWPSCRDLAPNIEVARNAFFSYALTQSCWIDYYGPTKLSAQIGKLS